MTPSSRECSPELLNFGTLKGRKVIADFSHIVTSLPASKIPPYQDIIAIAYKRIQIIPDSG